ncbi:MAG: DNA-binding protein [Nanoarchaeota archaeon]
MENNQTESKERENKYERRKENENVIFIGSKPLVNYIRGVITQFTKWNASEVTIKSRGKFISKAVDVAEVAKRSLEEKKIHIKGVNIASESFETDGKKTNISTMDIVLAEK